MLVLYPGSADNVNHPSRYASTRIECIDAIEAMTESWIDPVAAILLANVVKYVWRHTQKQPLESLKKARWYLDRQIQRMEAGK